MANPQVLVIGAGIAGLTAAHTLLKAGLNVTTLEARHRIGGRIDTDNSLGAPCDLGAMWLHGPIDNPLTVLLKHYEIPTLPWRNRGAYILDDNNQPYSHEILMATHSTYYKLLKQTVLTSSPTTISYNTALAHPALRDYLSSLSLSLRDWLLLNPSMRCGRKLETLSAHYWLETKTFDGGNYAIPQGYSALVNQLSQNADIKLNTIVESIDYSDQDKRRIHVTTRSNNNEQKIYSADAVIVTVPLGPLKNSAIQFMPALPSYKKESIQKIGFTPFNKIFLRFPYHFTKDVEGTFYCARAARDSQILFFIDCFPMVNKPILAATFSRRTHEMTESVLVDDAMKYLHTIFGDNIPEPDKVIASDWDNDPFTGGAVSYLTPELTPKVFDTLAENINNQIFFAGEATHAECWGTVHGAYQSGIREANNIIKLYS